MEYSPSNALLYGLGAVFVVASVLAVLALFPAIEHGAANDWVRTIAFGVIALAALWSMVAWEPSVVTVRDGTLEVGRGSGVEKADLRDPAVRAETSGGPSSAGWKLTVHRPDDQKPLVVRGNQVRRRQFERIVSYHQAHPHEPQDDEGTDEAERS
ncbi:MAG: hypothetical protein JOZ82_12860 [Marmoricola sp.]|nr:hypothetical protein [Marmoricola sp.]